MAISRKTTAILLLLKIGTTWGLESSKCDEEPGVRGQCRAFFKRYTYDKNQDLCKMFIYGGCGGNKNLFVTRDECEQVCKGGNAGSSEITESDQVETTRKLTTTAKPRRNDGAGRCVQPLEKGSCRAFFRRFGYDTSQGDCRAFVYGGCGGNENNFHAIEECRQVCSNVGDMQNDAIDPTEEEEEEQAEQDPVEIPENNGDSGNKNAYCTEPLERGPCRGYLKKYGYDSASNKCKTFIFGGCSGNKNNFNSVQDCRHKCVLKDGETHAVKKAPTTIEPEATEEPKELCESDKNPGYCKVSELRYTFDSNKKKCVNFLGCPSAVGQVGNNFESLEDCQESCREKNEVFAKEIEEVEEFIPTLKTLTTTVVSDYDKCQQSMSRGVCRGFFRKIYYDSGANACKTFVYGGCGGNENRFDSLEDCEKQCKLDIPTTQQVTTTTTTVATPYAEPRSFEHPAIANKTICKTGYERGSGRSYSVKFYWNDLERRCKPFRFSGAGGNENRFDSLSECEKSCATLENVEPMNIRCLKHHEAGPCEAAVKRWHYKESTETCSQFFWANCMMDGITFNGDRNNFITREQCECHCQRPESCQSKCVFHDAYHFKFLGQDVQEGDGDSGKTYRAVVCRNLDSTIGDFFDMSKLHKNIEMIDLRDNQLNVDDMHVLRMILKNMPDLKIALLGGNQFYKELDDHMFHMNSNLLYLDVSNAGVHEFHKDTFDYLVSLKYLNISNNGMDKLTGDQFHLMVDVEYLDISSNKFTDFKPKLLQSNRNLKMIDMSRNQFTTLPKATFKNQESLKIVKMDQNPWTSLESSIFHHTPELDHVSIRHCPDLKGLPRNFFQQNMNLEQVLLSGNERMDEELSKDFFTRDGVVDLIKVLHRRGFT